MKRPDIWVVTFDVLAIIAIIFILILATNGCAHRHGKQGELCYQQAVTGQVICPSDVQKKLDEKALKAKAKQDSSK